MDKSNTAENFLRKRRWRRYLVLVLLQCILLAGVARAQQNDREKDRSKLRVVIATLAQSWNRGDVSALARYFSEAALLMTPAGDGATRWEIHRRLALELERRLRGSRLNSSIAAIDFPTDNIAVVEGRYRISGVSRAAGLTSVVEGPFVLSLHRSGDHWQIAWARLYRAAEKKLALRDAHSQRYPFVQSAGAESLVGPESQPFFEGNDPAPRPFAASPSLRSRHSRASRSHGAS